MAPKRKTQQAKAPTSNKKNRRQSKSRNVHFANEPTSTISSANQVVNVPPSIEVTDMPMALTSAAMATGTPSATTLAFQLLSNCEVSLSKTVSAFPHMQSKTVFYLLAVSYAES